MSLSASVIAAIKKIHQLANAPEERQQKVIGLQSLITKSLTVHAKVCAEARESIAEDDTLNGKDKDGLSPLMWAAKLGLTDILPILLAGNPPHVPGAQMELLDNMKRTALHHAAGSGQLAAVKFLCQDAKGMALLESRDKNDCSPLFLAAGMHNAAVVQYLVQEQKADVQRLAQVERGVCSGNFQTPVSVYVLNAGQDRYDSTSTEAKVNESDMIVCLDVLHTAGADFNIPLKRQLYNEMWRQTNTYELYPLGIAAEHGYAQVIEYMISKQANVNVRNCNGYYNETCTMLQCALREQRGRKLTMEDRKRTIQALLTGKPSPEIYVSAVQYAMHLDNKSVDSLIALLRTPEILAHVHLCKKDFVSLAKFPDGSHFIKAFIDERAVTQEMMNEALLSATGNGAREIVKMLCESKPTPDQKALDQALDISISHDWWGIDMPVILIKSGANPAVKAENDKTIFDAAIQNDKYDSKLSSLRSLLAVPQVKRNAEGLAREVVQRLRSQGQASANIIKVFEEFGMGGAGSHAATFFALPGGAAAAAGREQGPSLSRRV